jgi:DNA (cytosine-5)-methyltransferase 1
VSLTAVDLFAGVGGFSLAMERAGIKVVADVEIDKAARSVLERRFPDSTHFTDITEVTGEQLRDAGFVPDRGILAGGFPCQDVSVAGRRAGLGGERSGLFWEIVRLVDELSPRWIVLENVPGLLSTGHYDNCDSETCSSCAPGRDFGAVLGSLAERGYGFAWRILDSQYFNVPQRRRRVFIVGCLGDPARAASVLFEPESCDGDSAPSREAGRGVAALTANGVGTCGADDNHGQAGHLIPEPYTVDWQAGSSGDTSFRGKARSWIVDKPGRSRSLTAQRTLAVAFHQIQDPITEVELSPALGAKTSGMGVAFSENQRGEVLETEISHQLTTGGGKPGQGYPAVRQDMQVRRLTPLECERLQGFPDGWTDSLSDSARYRTLGNAVAVPVAEWIARRIKEAA